MSCGTALGTRSEIGHGGSSTVVAAASSDADPFTTSHAEDIQSILRDAYHFCRWTLQAYASVKNGTIPEDSIQTEDKPQHDVEVCISEHLIQMSSCV